MGLVTMSLSGLIHFKAFNIRVYCVNLLCTQNKLRQQNTPIPEFPSLIPPPQTKAHRLELKVEQVTVLVGHDASQAVWQPRYEVVVVVVGQALSLHGIVFVVARQLTSGQPAELNLEQRMLVEVVVMVEV